MHPSLWRRVVRWFRVLKTRFFYALARNPPQARVPISEEHSLPTASIRYLWVQAAYIQAAGEFADAVSYLYMGECVGFKEMLDRWQEEEACYLHCGFRALSMDVLLDLPYGKKIEGLGVMREHGEAPVSHAQRYRERYLGKAASLMEVTGVGEHGVVAGTMYMPTTED